MNKLTNFEAFRVASLKAQREFLEIIVSEKEWLDREYDVETDLFDLKRDNKGGKQ